MKRTARMAGAFFGAVTLVATVVWYQFAAQPLTQAEVDAYMAKIEAQADTTAARHDMAALRQFLQNDNGLPFYTVNLYRFHDLAAYSEGSTYSGTGAAAYDRFSATMVKLLAARASHPIFGSSWSDAYASSWDRVVIVRYRSRRDIASLFASDEFAAASEHKWAAIKQNERMLVHGVHLPSGLIVAFFLAALAFLLASAGTGKYLRLRP